MKEAEDQSQLMIRDLYRRLMEFIGDGVYRYTFDDGRILLANKGLVNILNLDCAPEDLVGKRLKDVLIYTDKEGSVRHALEKDGAIHGFEYHFKTLKGEDRWVIHDSLLIVDPLTKQQIVEAIVKDITERKKAERQLAAEEERLRVTLRSIGDGVIATDTAGKIVLMNSVAEQLTGWTQEAARGKPLPEIFQIINEKTRQPCINPVEKVLQSGIVVGLANHTALIARDGAERSIADSGAPIRDPGGAIIGVVLVFRDVTESKQAEEALKRSETLLHEMGVMARVGGWEVNLATGKQLWTDEVYRIHEVDKSTYKPTAAAGIQFYAPSDRPIIERAFQRTMDYGEPYDLELEFITAKGNKRWVHTMGKAHQENGKTNTIAGTFQDITERKQAEEELQKYRLHLEELVEERTAELIKANEGLQIEIAQRTQAEEAFKTSEELFRTAAASLTDVVYDWNIKEKVDWYGDIDGIMGYPAGEFPRTLEGWAATIHPEDKTRVMAALEDHLKNAAPYAVEYRVMRKDGEWQWWSARGTALRDERGEPYKMVGSIANITERKRAEEAARESDERFRATFEQAAVGIAQVGLDGHWLRVNQRLCDIVGYTREELLQCTFLDITYPEDLNADLAFVQQILAGEISNYSMEKRYRRKDSSLVWVNLTVSLVRDEAATPKYFVSVVENISDRKRAEEKLSAAMGDLERSNKELEQFAYVASHDLQEPLRKVASFTQLLAERYGDKLDAEATQFIAYAVDGAHRMQGLINDLLAFSRVGIHGKTFAPVDCETILAQALANLEMTIKESGAVVTHEQLPTVMGDAPQLVQLFQNLIGNAVKFKRPDVNPVIHIRAKRVMSHSSLKKGLAYDNDSFPMINDLTTMDASQAPMTADSFWLFSVRDNGIGIDPQYFKRLFVIFQRLNAKAKYPGSGIGLAISKKVVDRHGGRIWVESKPGEGSTFYFTIPGG